MKRFVIYAVILVSACAHNQQTLVCTNTFNCKESIGGQVVYTKIVDQGNGQLLRMSYIQAGKMRYFCEEHMSAGVPDTMAHLSTCMQDPNMKFPQTQ